MARALVLATLPHRPTAENFFQRSNGGYKLTLSRNDPKVGLPSGTYPRLILAWLSTEVVKTQNQTVKLGSSMTSFMKKLGILPTGGRWGSIPRLKDQTRKLANCTFNISQTTISDDGATENVKNLVVAEESAFHWAKNPDQADLWDSSITLSEAFYREIIEHPVPLDVEILKALRRSPLALDIYSWLTYRSSYQKGRSKPILWESLQEQFGSGYQDTAQGKRDFKKNFIKQLKKVSKFYEGANVEIVDNGLRLNKGRPSVPKVTA